jgi:hypothetical protein
MHWITYVSVFLSEAVLVGLWFGSHGSALRFLGELNKSPAHTSALLRCARVRAD